MLRNSFYFIKQIFKLKTKMSDNPSEYLKRTCLICGCHTNQTINIYEPRSGPNIVQLIQAKFKFQVIFLYQFSLDIMGNHISR